jgi:ribosomal protein L31
MPKRGLQPWLRTVTIWLKDGSAIKTKALYTGKNVKDQIVLSREPSTHPAWTGERKVIDSEDGAYKQFQKRFGFQGQAEGTSLVEKFTGAKKTKK